jgi:uncharacterized protein (TIGR01777 family)
MKIVIPGGSGQVGTLLARAFVRNGHDVVVLSRRAATGSAGFQPAKEAGEDAAAPWRVVPWDAETLGAWSEEIDGADVVINLAGRSVNCRYTPENRRLIVDSRVRSTRVVGEAIACASRPPAVWLQASTATIYAHRYDAPNDDVTGIVGGDEAGAPDTWRFSIDVARAWEKAVDDAATPATRKVKLRSAMIMNPDRGSIFDTLLGLVRRGLGGRAADGRQFISWIHYLDFIAAVYWLIRHDELQGAVNVASPNPLPNEQFMRALRQAWGTRIGLPATRLMLEIGAFLMRSETELVLKSRRVVPARLIASGFEFQYPEWGEAARELCGEWREMRR